MSKIGNSEIFKNFVSSSQVWANTNPGGAHKNMCAFPTPVDKSAMVGIPASNANINLRKVDELRHSLEEEINNFYSDLDCYRFLSKHNYNITKTKDMLIKHYHWYTSPVRTWKIQNPDLSPRDMGKVPIDSKQSEYDRVFPCSFLGEDLEGHPIFWEKAGYSKLILTL